MRLNSNWPEWVIRQGNACVWVQAPSAEVAVKFVTERVGPMGGWRTGPGVEQEVLPRAKYSEHAMPGDYTRSVIIAAEMTRQSALRDQP